MMKIGTKVKVKNFAAPEYGNLTRRWKKIRAWEVTGWYVGYTYKQNGVIITDKYGMVHLGYREDIKLLRIKTSDRANDSFAFPEDVEVIYET